MKVFFCPVTPHIWKCICLRAPTLYLVVLLIRLLLQCSQYTMWCYWQGNTKVPKEKPLAELLFSLQISHGLTDLRSNPGPQGLSCGMLKAWDSSKYYIKIQFLPHSKHTVSPQQRQALQCFLYEITAIYSQNHIKKWKKLCRQNM